MDWFPTLLEAAGVARDPDYPSDGLRPLPILTGQSAPVPRKLFWRYKTNAQRAMRDGDYKYLKIRDNSFLFDVVADPRERANLWGRQPDVVERMLSEWQAWNATMLPEIPDSFGETYTAAQFPDHIGLIELFPSPPLCRRGEGRVRWGMHPSHLVAFCHPRAVMHDAAFASSTSTCICTSYPCVVVVVEFSFRHWSRSVL